MAQGDTMNMNNEQAVSILIPLRDMMRDQYGCPISDAYFALDKAIEALKQPTVTLPEPEWISTKEMQPPKPNGAKYYNLDGEDIAADEYNVMIKGATEPTSLFWSGDVWFSPYGIDAGYTYNVTHWMPLPEPYRGEQE
jgi:hypothetical protein